MIAHSWALAWMAGAGAAGGALNAIVTDNLALWPSRVASSAGPRLFRPGLAVNVVVGAAVSAGTFWTVAELRAGGSNGAGSVLMGVLVGLVIGLLGARSISDESDKRFLRAAACKAAGAPAADPATIRQMGLVPPHAVLKTAATLEPRRATLR